MACSSNFFNLKKRKQIVASPRENRFETLSHHFPFLTRAGISQIPKELEIDGEPFMTYTPNVYIIRENHDTDTNLFDRE